MNKRYLRPDGSVVWGNLTITALTLTGEVSGSVHLWENALHPNDAAGTRQALNDYVQGRVPAYHHEYRIITRSGEVRWHRGVGKVVAWKTVEGDATADGVTGADHSEIGVTGTRRALRMIGTDVDITEQKETEAQVRQALQTLNLAAELAEIGTWDFVKDQIVWDERLSPGMSQRRPSVPPRRG
jgi:PAS domain-containing protein